MSPGTAHGAGPGSARYSERQVRCLEAMGLIAWVSRAPARVPSEAPSDAGASADPVRTSSPEPTPRGEPGPVARPGPQSEPESAPEAPVAGREAPTSAPAAAPLPPRSTDGPAGRVPPAGAAPDGGLVPSVLSARRVRRFRRRGQEVFETRPGEGRALVLVEPGPEGATPGAAPLDGEPAALFLLMLRAIGLTAEDVSLCALEPVPGDGRPGPGGGEPPTAEPRGPAVRELLGGARRTVLWLTHDVDGAGPVDPGGDAALRALGAGVFRVPHPALLLARPLAKREAWAALKAARRRLGGDGAAAAGASR